MREAPSPTVTVITALAHAAAARPGSPLPSLTCPASRFRGNGWERWVDELRVRPRRHDLRRARRRPRPGAPRTARRSRPGCRSTRRTQERPTRRSSRPRSALPPHGACCWSARAGSRSPGCRGSEVEESKVGQRHVQGRTKAGGQSQQRFARRRDNQARQAYEAAAEHAARILTGRMPVVTGGDHAAVEAVLSDRGWPGCGGRAVAAGAGAQAGHAGRCHRRSGCGPGRRHERLNGPGQPTSRRRNATCPAGRQGGGDRQHECRGRPVHRHGRHQRQVLERRDVPDPVGEPQRLPEHHHHDAEQQAEPGQGRRPRPDAVQQRARRRRGAARRAGGTWSPR